MKQIRISCCWQNCFAAAASGSLKESRVPTIASAMDREISDVEKEIVEAAEAMPEDKFNFSPESLKIPGADYKGVRTFAWRSSTSPLPTMLYWSPITGDKLPEGLRTATVLRT